MGTVLILTNSSGGLYDFRNEFVQALTAKHEVVVSMPDEVKEKELAAEGCRIIKTPINRRGINPLEDLKLYRTYSRMMKEPETGSGGDLYHQAKYIWRICRGNS